MERGASVRARNAVALYRTFWRWHFYAGLFVLPFILVLATTGSIYLFKPQVERWEERNFTDLGTAGMVSADRQLDAAMAAVPGGRFNHYRLPRAAGDAAMVQVGLPTGGLREVFVSPQGRMLGVLDPDERIEAIVSRIHGSLFIGTVGDWIVELAASWTIVMILTGLYMWWPRPFRLAGAVYPRLSLRGRPLLKDIHRVLGFWIAGLMLVMLASGLPWAGAWGSAFKWARTELGLVQGPQDWKIGVDGGHAGHDHGAAAPMTMTSMPSIPGLPLSTFVTRAEAEHMAYPVLVLPPHAPQQFGPPTGDVWTLKSAAQNRWLDRQVSYDPRTGKENGRRGFADQHVLDRIVNTGVAWHEGQLFGWVNQLIGLLTAVSLIAVSVLGVLMWWRRRPVGSFAAPEPAGASPTPWPIVALVLLGLAMPLFGLSVLLLSAGDLIGRSLRMRSAY